MDRKKASDFPQELLDLFHLYVHGEIDRSAFLRGAQKFAVGGITATGLWAMLKPNFAWANEVPEDDKRIVTDTVTIPSSQGNGPVKAYYVKPAGVSGKIPAIIVVHENRGVNPYIKDVARRLAVQKYIALAPDALSSLGGYTGDEEKAATMFASLNRDKMTEDFVASAQWLAARPEVARLGAVGFCYGGGVVNTLAVRMPALAAAVPFYGQPPDAADVAKIKAPVLAHFAQLDTRLTAQWPAYDSELTAAKIPHAGYVYTNANHGFHNDTTPRYDEAAAKLAWSRTLEWFTKYLRA